MDVVEPDTGAGLLLWLPEGTEIHSDPLTPIGTENGRSLYADGSAGVVFTLTGDREELSAAIVKHFATEPWRQRSTQYLNPRSATSFDDGWQRRCACVIQTDDDGNPIPREPHYEWVGEWEDPRGNIISYSLWAEGRQLRGYTAYVPKRLVDAGKRTLGITER